MTGMNEQKNDHMVIKTEKRITMRILLFILLALAILPGSSGFSQPANDKTAFSLAEAQLYAVQNNVNVQNARLDVDAARQLIWENTATGLPQVTAGASYNNNLQLMTTLIPAEFFGGEPGTYMPVKFGTQHNATANIVASQLLFSGPYIVGLQAASKYKDLTEKTLVKSETDIREAVAQSYYAILLAEAGKDAFGKNLESMRLRLEETKAMLQTGFLEETDADQIQIAVATLENEHNAAVQFAEISYRFLVFQMGYDINTEITITETLDEIIAGLSEDLLRQEFVIEDHIDYKILNAQEQLAYLQVKMNKFEYMPTLSASLSHSQMAMRQNFNFHDFDQDWYPSTLLGFNLNVPVFASGMRKAKIGQSKIALDKTRNMKMDLAKGLELSVQQSRVDFNIAYDKYLNEKNNIELAQKVFDRTSVKYQNGVVSSLELTVATDQLTGVQTGYISAMVDLLTAKLRLDKALGNL